MIFRDSFLKNAIFFLTLSAICIQSMGNFENIWKKSLPVAVAVVLFGVVALVGFAPQLEGKVLPQHDIQQFDCSSQDIRDCREKFDEDPQWTGAMFSGMPAYQINIKYPSQIIKRSAESVQSIFEGPASMIFFAMLSAFVMAIMMGMSAWIGIIIGLAYGLSTYFFIIIGAGHITKMWALVYAPAMLGAIHYTLRRNMWVGGALTALFAALEIGANHLQMTYYFLFAAAALFISELIYAIKEARYTDFGKRTAILGVAAFLAIGANFAPLYYTQQHTEDTTRGGSAIEGQSKGLDIKYATDWSYGIGESWNMLIPNLMGGDSGGNNTFAEDGAVAKKFEEFGVSKEESKEYAQSLPTYWGEQGGNHPYTAGPTYLGAIVIFLALLGLLLAENRDRWWILAATILTIFMAWGHNAMWFTEFCFKYVPFYDKFRSVSSALVVAEWSIPLLAGMALWQIHKHWGDRRLLSKSILISGGIVGGICLIFALGGLFIHDTWLCDFGIERSIASMGEALGDKAIGYEIAEAMAAEQRDMLIYDAVRSLIFVLLGTGLLYGALYISRKWALAILGGLAALIVVDILPINLRYVPHKKFVSADSVENEVQPNALNRAIMKDKEPGYRVLDALGNPFNDATASKFHRSIGGYHGAKMGRYQDLIDFYLGREVATINQAVSENKTPDMQTLPILNMLNTKYVITRNGIVYNDYARNGAAWFVDNLVGAEDALQELAALGEIDLKTTAVVAAGTTAPREKGKGSIKLMSYRPNNLRYNYTLTGGPGVAVFSEIYYDKGWQAYVDGKPAESFRADYLLRAMVLPEGSHTVEWRFEAPNWSSTSKLTLICSLLIILALITVITLKCYGIYKKKEII